ncbi:uncharacterized protein APUU_11394S [Aspergillus puulaauensis]|uniref:FAD/NAD(P)-binding domain-containing protein n=1 Tax=Aspergillus puulaauensis TaxID=1220207 RepID=A0A7R8AH23_9EURO|nr:uncharacterized protein APUU_11394S [Aspergillus puulaauensis]BCS18566.1 hypothetical protein APUU_11394S [Aspergillus puulaauensis]
MDTDTIIIGNGPSSMILSYILHGYLPYYSPQHPHPDPLLHAKLKGAPALLGADVDALTEHFAASRLSYSTQALPVNVLLDTLVRPSVDVEELQSITNVEWRYEPEKAIPHKVFGNAPRPGGQWTENRMPASWEIQTLSYASMLSLPGYSFADHYRKTTGKDLPAYTRPSRQDTADYFQAYPAAVGIDDAFCSNENVWGIIRNKSGFYLRSHNIQCRHLALASGVFSEVLQPRPLIRPLTLLQPVPETPLLVIGSGFSAADVIISAPGNQKIIHVFKWDPENRPSPLRGCHQHAYPEYAGVYRLMRRAAIAAQPKTSKRVKPLRTNSSPFLESRAWAEIYEGFPNTEIIDVQTQDEIAIVTFRCPAGNTLTRHVRGMVYATGRRGSLGYLDQSLLREVIGSDHEVEANPTISGQTLRGKAIEDVEVAKDVFIIGSLTGDSLIRFAYGSCVQAAGKLVNVASGNGKAKTGSNDAPRQELRIGVMRGIDGHDVFPNGGQLRADPDNRAMARAKKLPEEETKGIWAWIMGVLNWPKV